jgi:hypothetical protein
MIVEGAVGSEGMAPRERFRGIMTVGFFIRSQLEKVIRGVFNEGVAIFTKGMDEFIHLLGLVFACQRYIVRNMGWSCNISD